MRIEPKIELDDAKMNRYLRAEVDQLARCSSKATLDCKSGTKKDRQDIP